MSKGIRPKITVLTSAYNAERFISLAIESILKQTFTDFEFLIIDDGSSDSSWDIIQRYGRKDSRIRSFQNKTNQGICYTLNRGLKLARARYIARMDADDWSYPERLEKQFRLMEENPKVVLCGGAIEVCDENLKKLNKREYPKTDKEVRDKIFCLNPFAHPATMYRAEIAHRVGGYNPALADAEDYDLYFRLGRHGQFANLSDTILKLRVHPGSISSQRVSHQAWLNLYIRLKAIREYGYRPTRTDKIFLAVNFLAGLMVPSGLKFRLFNWWRRIYY